MPDPDPTWLDYLSAIGAVATPVLVLVLTAIGWRIRHDLERRSDLEGKLREDRIEAYNKILEPFIVLLLAEAAWKSDPKNKGKDKNQMALQTMLSLDYRRQAFKMALVGSDSVVKAYNNLMQHVFGLAEEAGSEGATGSDPKKLISLLGGFLLEIRRSMGNETTTLDNWDMLEWFLTDARKMRSEQADAADVASPRR